MSDDIETRINKLLTDPDFLELVNFQNRPNLFSTLAVSHTEMWHSAFVKFLIDPASHLGLGTFPLRRFLFAVMHVGRTSLNTRKPDLSLGDLEDMVLDDIEFGTEFSFSELRNKRIDIIGLQEEVSLASREGETSSIRIIIENKITARESNDQTSSYYESAKRSSEDFQYDFFIFLTPDESQMPKSDQFIQLTYQDLCDLIIRPCLNHPALPDESKYLLQQYLLNLRNPTKGGYVMALPNKELCQRIYLAHKNVLNEIFLSVKGMAPRSTSRGRRIRTFTVTLEQLVEKDILTLQDSLYKTWKGTVHDARLDRNNNTGMINIIYKENRYDSPSSAASVITGGQINGWTFWNVKNEHDADKGSLSQLRKRLVRGETPETGD